MVVFTKTSPFSNRPHVFRTEIGWAHPGPPTPRGRLTKLFSNGFGTESYVFTAFLRSLRHTVISGAALAVPSRPARTVRAVHVAASYSGSPWFASDIMELPVLPWQSRDLPKAIVPIPRGLKFLIFENSVMKSSVFGF